MFYAKRITLYYCSFISCVVNCHPFAYHFFSFVFRISQLSKKPTPRRQAGRGVSKVEMVPKMQYEEKEKEVEERQQTIEVEDIEDVAVLSNHLKTSLM